MTRPTIEPLEGRRLLSASQAVPADSLVDFIGTAPGFAWKTKAVQRFDTLPAVLQDIGIRHLRESGDLFLGISPDGLTGRERLRALADMGFSVGLVASYLGVDGEPSRVLDFVKSMPAGSVSYVEGSNEPDNFDGDGDWLQEAIAHQRDLFTTFKNDAATAHIPIVTPSVITEQAANQLGAGIAGYADAGNVHHYWAGRQPETGGWGANGYGSIPWQHDYVADVLAPGKPFYVTETGYNTAGGLDLETVTTYFPRLVTEYFRRGQQFDVERIYLFEALNTASENRDWGLINLDGTLRPQGLAIKNLIATFADPGVDFVPGSLDVDVTGGSNVRTVLTQKADGDFYLAAWSADAVENPNGGANYGPFANDITITVNGAAVEEAEVFVFREDGTRDVLPVDVTGGGGVIDTVAGSELRVFRLDVGAGPVVQATQLALGGAGGSADLVVDDAAEPPVIGRSGLQVVEVAVTGLVSPPTLTAVSAGTDVPATLESYDGEVARWQLAEPLGVGRVSLTVAAEGGLELLQREADVLPGDADGDGVVTLADFGILRSSFGQSVFGDDEGDFDGDGVVTLADFGILRSNFGRGV